MARTINIEGVIVELPDSGFSKSCPPIENEKILGFAALFGLFLLTIPWGSIIAAIPFSLLGIDAWTGIAMLLILFLRLIMLIFREPIGGTVRGGVYSSGGKMTFFYDTLGEMVITLLLCLLVAFKNPLAFLFVIVLILGRFRVTKQYETGDFDRWYPAFHY